MTRFITTCKIAAVDLSSQVSKGQHMRYMELHLLRDPNVAILSFMPTQYFNMQQVTIYK